MAFYDKSGRGLILGFCIIAILVVRNEALHEGYRRCNNYCMQELKATSYDCYLFCFFKCAPSMGGSGCFKSMEQAGQSLNIPAQFLVKNPASEPTSYEQWTREMNPKSKSNFDFDDDSKFKSKFDADADADVDVDADANIDANSNSNSDVNFKFKSNSNYNSGVGLN